MNGDRVNEQETSGKPETNISVSQPVDLPETPRRKSSHVPNLSHSPKQDKPSSVITTRSGRQVKPREKLNLEVNVKKKIF